MLHVQQPAHVGTISLPFPPAAAAFQRFPNVQHMRLTDVGMNSAGMMDFLARNASMMQRLRYVEAHFNAFLFSATWDSILKACDPATLRCWAPCPANRRQPAFVTQVLRLAEWQPCCALRSLDLSLSSVKDAELARICAGAQQLRCLVLDSCTKLTDVGLGQACAQLADLQDLSIDKCMHTCEGLMMLTSLQHLTRLVVGWNLTSAAGCDAIAALPHLRELVVYKLPTSFPCLDLLSTGRATCAGVLQRVVLQAAGADLSKAARKQVDALRCLVPNVELQLG
jgi:hypothetical protein